MATGARAKLPYREKTEVYLLVGRDRVLAQDRRYYVMFPGGGVERGERASTAARREVLEETGAVVDGPLRHLITVDWDWFPEWQGDDPKRRERYRKFRGERVHFPVGRASPMRTSTSDETDVWQGAKTMPISRCRALVERYGKRDHPNTASYRVAQQLALEHIKVMGHPAKRAS